MLRTYDFVFFLHDLVWMARFKTPTPAVHARCKATKSTHTVFLGRIFVGSHEHVRHIVLDDNQQRDGLRFDSLKIHGIPSLTLSSHSGEEHNKMRSLLIQHLYHTDRVKLYLDNIKENLKPFISRFLHDISCGFDLDHAARIYSSRACCDYVLEVSLTNAEMEVLSDGLKALPSLILPDFIQRITFRVFTKNVHKAIGLMRNIFKRSPLAPGIIQAAKDAGYDEDEFVDYIAHTIFLVNMQGFRVMSGRIIEGVDEKPRTKKIEIGSQTSEMEMTTGKAITDRVAMAADFPQDFVAEMLRRVSTCVTVVLREPKTIEIAGISYNIPAGTLTTLSPNNMDPEVFENPEELRIGRDHTKQLNFGGVGLFSTGPRSCLGSKFALDSLAALCQMYASKKRDIKDSHGLSFVAPTAQTQVVWLLSPEKLRLTSYAVFGAILVAAVIVAKIWSDINFEHSILHKTFGYNNVCIYLDHRPVIYFFPLLWSIVSSIFSIYLYLNWVRMRMAAEAGVLGWGLFRVLTVTSLLVSLAIGYAVQAFANTPDEVGITMHTVPFMVLMIGIMVMSIQDTVYFVACEELTRVQTIILVGHTLLLSIVTVAKLIVQGNGLTEGSLYDPFEENAVRFARVIDNGWAILATVIPAIIVSSLQLKMGDQLRVRITREIIDHGQRMSTVG